MAKSDFPHLLFSSISEFQPKWSPFGFTHTLSPSGTHWGASQQRTASISEGSTNPQAINPELLQPHEQHSAGVPASPLRSVSRDLFDSESEYDGPATAAGRREQSEGDMGLETGDCVLEASSAGEGANLVKRRRNPAWLSRSDLKRARSKIHQQEVAYHLSDLEALTKAQAERLSKLTALVERLQRENTTLKKCQWSAAFGNFRDSARGARSSMEGVQELVPSDRKGEARAGLKQATQ
ncbi:hypothetical protein EHS25_005542 [Saitozyma podzolica]|uniref:Uncharacterized protein n=1 Tax=Saitozyma podzolica TaxID=1890683 RepID=A0A427XXN9_9TREE|nr:hypothetical protein EHS25_005542 [Saitozyma podzolica]